MKKKENVHAQNVLFRLVKISHVFLFKFHFNHFSPIQSDLFAVELLNGHIYIHVDLGSGAFKVRASRRRVDDGTWHELILRRTGRECKVSIDGQWNDFRTPGDATQFEFDSPIYLGGLGSSYNNINTPPAVWTATLKQGFIGCLRDLMLTGKPVDIAAFARQQDSGLFFFLFFSFLLFRQKKK